MAFKQTSINLLEYFLPKILISFRLKKQKESFEKFAGFLAAKAEEEEDEDENPDTDKEDRD